MSLFRENSSQEFVPSLHHHWMADRSDIDGTPVPDQNKGNKPGICTPTATIDVPAVFTFEPSAVARRPAVAPAKSTGDGEASGHSITDSVQNLLLSDSPHVPVALPNKKPAKRKKKLSKLPPRKTFDELYEMGDRLGTGAFSIVNECIDKSTKQTLAVKIMVKASSKYNRKQVLEEIDILMRARDGPNVIYFHRHVEETDRFCLVFEKLNGGDLFECIKGLKTFTERQASLVVRDVAKGLTFLHSKGIAHRDLKPANVLCRDPGKVSPAKIADFNLATVVKTEGSFVQPLTTPVGTPEFMSPELATAISLGEDAHYNYTSDLWSLGVIAYLILSGRPPFKGIDGSMDSKDLNEQRATMKTESLLESISEGKFSFPAADWKHVSGAAKDLIGRLLVRAEDRLPAMKVLQHPWLKFEAPAIVLKTPTIFRDKEKRKHLVKFTEAANETHRRMGSTSKDGLKLANPSSSTLLKHRHDSLLLRPFAEARHTALEELVTPKFT
eukprot:TRINITY_DN8942_c0_g2_i1.p1 TRINITY_DN8942_c0_g2~~TRINITY_DN8942_c0_g2_i1.p1  ORF type:complete len:498 (+),score=120.02 TRINITY_DN8942_c0_g2_i1:110-1603(+)